MVGQIKRVVSVQFSSVAQSCLTLCDPMNRSTPGLPVHHRLPEFTQTHVHRVRDAIESMMPSSHLILSWVQFCAALWTASPPGSLSMGFSRQEYQSGLPRPSPFPTQRLNPHLLCLKLFLLKFIWNTVTSTMKALKTFIRQS